MPWLLLLALAVGQNPEPAPGPATVAAPSTAVATESEESLPPPPAPAESRGDGGGDRGRTSVSSNPAAVNIVTGTGALGRLLGLDEESGVRLGGLWIGDASGILAGGSSPGRWGLNGLTVVDLNLDGQKLFG